MCYTPLNPPSRGDYKEVWTVELSIAIKIKMRLRQDAGYWILKIYKDIAPFFIQDQATSIKDQSDLAAAAATGMLLTELG